MQLTAGGLLQGGKYLLNHPLETQGFGITYRATQTQTGQAVVVKTLHPALHSSKAFVRLRDRFVDVGSLMTKCPHASLVKVLDLFQEEQLPFMVMEYVAGTSLAEMVAPDRPMAEMEALHYVRLAGGAMAAAHGIKLIHGNLKPQNILRRAGGNTPVVLGYGISADRMLSAVQYAVPGFPHAFTAPEQIGERGDRLPLSDLYGLAANLYFLLTGYAPPSASERLQQDSLPHLDRVSPMMQRVLLQGLALELKHRSPSLGHWLDLLPTASAPRAKANPRVTSLPEAIAATQIPAPASAPTVMPMAPTVIEPPYAVVEPVMDRSPAPEPPRYRSEPLPQASVQASPQAPAPEMPRYRAHPIEVQMELELDSVPTRSVSGYPVAGRVDERVVARSMAANTLLNFTPRLRRMLLLTGCIAMAIGGSFGLALRFSAARAPNGGSIFHAGQEFPDRDWSGTLTPADTGDSPIEAPPANPGKPQPSESPAFNPSPIIDQPTSNRIATPEKTPEAAPEAPAPATRRERREDPPIREAPPEKLRRTEPIAPREVAPEVAPEPPVGDREPPARTPESPVKPLPKFPVKSQ
jgi:eukaryotic-like serine/threonine-protein kinase